MQVQREQITLKRDCEATEIPYGQKSVLKAGADVTITQALGDSFTVITDQGFLARIEGRDADALGKTISGPVLAPPPAGDAPAGPEEPLEKRIWDQMRTCYDPEIPVNIVELGLIYECKIAPEPEGGSLVEIRMTLTAPGCGMGDILKADVERKVGELPGVKTVKVEMVVDPPWGPAMMSDAAKLQLGIL